MLDLAPTWLEAANVAMLPRLEGKSILPIMTDRSKNTERAAFFERNWHDNLDLIRGVRSGRYLLIENYRPEIAYPPTLDVANSPTWSAILQLHKKGELPRALEKHYFAAPRSEVELYNIEDDPFQLQNLAGESTYASSLAKLQKLLSDWMISTNDFLPPPIPPVRGTQGEAVHP